MTANDRHYCTIAAPTPMEGRTRAALLDQTKWSPGTRITAQFLSGDQSVQDRVLKVAEEWFGPDMANLSLDWVTDGGDVRIAFEEGNGSWSYLGTVAQQIPIDQPTMNYGWLGPDSSEEELRRVVLHEFGHALGLVHEHQNPDQPISWNRAAVVADLSGPPNYWDEATIENNIFMRYDPAELTTTPTDAASIMMYPIPASWTTDGFSVGLNGELSETDVQFIRDAYAW